MIKIILLNKNKLGKIGSVVNVKSGYARNYLIPYNKAIYASEENIKRFKKRLSLIIKLEKEELSKINNLYKKIISLSPLMIKSKCSKNGKLFGSINSESISKIISNKINFNISKNFIILPNGPLKYVSEYKIIIFLYKKKKFSFFINIVSN